MNNKQLIAIAIILSIVIVLLVGFSGEKDTGRIDIDPITIEENEYNYMNEEERAEIEEQLRELGYIE